MASERDSSTSEPLLPTTYPPSPPVSSPSPKHKPYRGFRSLKVASRCMRVSLILTAAFLVLLALHGYFRPDYKAHASTAYDWAQKGWQSTTHPWSKPHPPDPTPTSPPNNATTDGNVVDPNAWTDDMLRTMVSRTKGYYVRDWSLGLGWNNMRYIIEASLLHAKLLNRTLVLPSFIYARGCEFAHEVCASYAPQVDRFKAVGWGRRDLDHRWEDSGDSAFGRREDGQADHTGWRIPIEYMLDLSHLRQAQPVLLVSEYLRIHNLSTDLEYANGIWARGTYHSSNPAPSLHVIPNGKYDPQSILRVDRLPDNVESDWTDEGTLIQARLQMKKGTSNLGLMEWDDVKSILRRFNGLDVDDDESFSAALSGAGLQVLYTFQGSRGIDLIKHVVEPLRQVAPMPMLRGLVDDYGDIIDDVLLLEGETHLFRKPGALRFTSEVERRNFESIVLVSLRPSERVLEVGDRVAERMAHEVEGRMWMAGHLRRGDFVELGWALEHDIDKHLALITSGLDKGLEVLANIKAAGDAHIAPVPGTHLYEEVWKLDLPLPDDPFFLATDERSPEALKYCREQGAILITDVLDFSDRRLYGWELLFSDIVMLVEQVVMSNAAFFYGYGASSVAGGTLNQRAARGMDPRTGVAE